MALWVAVIAVGAWLRCHDLGARPLGVDETAVVRDSRQSLAEIWSKPFRAPLQFTVVKLVRLFGESEWVYRIPSALAGVAGVAVFMVLVSYTVGKHAAAAGGLLMAMNAFHVAVSREGKYYAFVVLCSTLCLLFLMRISNNKGAGSLWGFVLSCVVCLYFHGYAAAVVVCQAPLAVWWWIRPAEPDSRPVWSGAAPLLFLLLACVPFLVGALSYGALGHAEEQVWGTDSFRPIDGDYYRDLLSALGVAHARWAFTAVAFVVGGACTARRQRVLALSLVTAVGPLLVVAFAKPMGYQHRYLSPLLPLILLILSAAAGSVVLILRRTLHGVLATLLTFGLGVLLTANAVHPAQYTERGADWRELGQSLQTRLRTGDVLILPEGGVWIELLKRYFDPGEGVTVLSSKELLRQPVASDRHETRWWVIRLPPSSIPVVKEGLEGDFEIESLVPGFLVLSRSGPSTREQVCLETARVLEALIVLQTGSARISTWPRRRAAAWTTIGNLLCAGGDTLGGRDSFFRALQEDSTFSASQSALRRLARARKRDAQ
jgi:hypothetical protein